VSGILAIAAFEAVMVSRSHLATLAVVVASLALAAAYAIFLRGPCGRCVSR